MSSKRQSALTAFLSPSPKRKKRQKARADDAKVDDRVVLSLAEMFCPIDAHCLFSCHSGGKRRETQCKLDKANVSALLHPEIAPVRQMRLLC